jgi:hypothetical protein
LRRDLQTKKLILTYLHFDPDVPITPHPKDLAGALKRLDDVEIDALLVGVTTEAERRGRRPPSPAKEKPVADAKPQRRQEAAERRFIDHWQGECSACRLQSRR